MSRFLKTLMLTSVTSMSLTLVHAADNDSAITREGKHTDQIAAHAEPQTTVVDRLASEFGSTFGTTDSTSKLITDLRAGSPTLTITDGTGGSVTFSQPAQKGKVGYGETFIILALTQASATSQGSPSPTAKQLEGAMITILTDRAAAMGWGKIAKLLNLNLGSIIAQLHSGNDRLANAVRHERMEKAERFEKAERPEKLERPEKPQRPDRPERPGKG